MGFLDRLLGREPLQTQGGYAGQAPSGGSAPSQPDASPPAPSQPLPSQPDAASADERAIARYRYLLRTAPPESLEQVHAEAFVRLTPEQRDQVLTELSSGLPAGETAPTSDPQSMARAATRAELRQPGYLEQTFSRSRFGGGLAGGGGLGMGGTIMGSMMGTIAGVVIGSAIADALFDGYDSSPEAAAAGDTTAGADGGGSDGSDGSGGDGAAGGGADPAADAGTDAGTDAGADSGVADSGYDAGGYDAGGFDSGGSGGGDFGGGDMGGF